GKIAVAGGAGIAPDGGAHRLKGRLPGRTPFEIRFHAPEQPDDACADEKSRRDPERDEKDLCRCHCVDILARARARTTVLVCLSTMRNPTSIFPQLVTSLRSSRGARSTSGRHRAASGRLSMTTI